MVYLAGDNNLSEAGETDLGEMKDVGSTSEVNIVAEFDRIGDDAHSKRYYVQKDNLQEVADLGETDTGDPNVLKGFIDWAADNYPAERYALILWNHGGGWEPSSIDTIAQEVGTKGYSRSEGTERSGTPLRRAFFRSTMQQIFSLESPEERAICSDDGSGHSLDTIELGKVLDLAVDKLGQPLDLLGMDACLMSNLEVAYQARDTVKYIVASEENEPFNGWPYDSLLARLVAEPNIPTDEFAAYIVDDYIRSYVDSGYIVTQTALDLSKVDQLTKPLDDLADALLTHMPQSAFEIWTAQRKTTGKFWHNTLWDIAHFCEMLAQDTTNEVVRKAAEQVHRAHEVGVGRFVVAEAHLGEKVDHCGGVTIYLMPPPNEISRYYDDLDYSTDYRWSELIKAYHQA